MTVNRNRELEMFCILYDEDLTRELDHIHMQTRSTVCGYGNCRPAVQYVGTGTAGLQYSMWVRELQACSILNLVTI
jgi:hypothetical protein